jgi:periplasmic divalent cation tolerance protein
MAAEYFHVHTATESRDDGRILARSIIESGLAARVQIVGPILTLSRWESAVEEAQEWMLLITTKAQYVSALEQHIRENSSYDTPEIVVTAIVGGSADYFTLISSQLPDAEVTP